MPKIIRELPTFATFPYVDDARCGLAVKCGGSTPKYRISV